MKEKRATALRQQIINSIKLSKELSNARKEMLKTSAKLYRQQVETLTAHSA